MAENKPQAVKYLLQIFRACGTIAEKRLFREETGMRQGKKLFERLTRCDWLFLVGFILVALFCLWKAPLEIQGQDEAFYLTIPKRLLDGDIFIADEWHGSQFAAVFSYPLIWLHRLFFGYDAIVLHFRYLYVFFQALCSAVIYACFRKHGLFAVLASLYFFLFTPFDIMALSYNTIGLMLVTLTGVILATAKRRRTYCLSGVLFSGAVLCCPHLAAGYALYSAAVLIYAAAARGRRNGILVKWGLFTLSCGVCAVLLLAFMLTRASFSEIWHSLPMLFSDPEHIQNPILDTLRYYHLCIVTMVPHGRVSSAVCVAALLMAVMDNRRSARKLFYLSVPSVIALATLAELCPNVASTGYNSIMFPLAPVGLMAFVVTEKKDPRVFLFTYLGGMTYSLCIFFSSNNGVYILTAMSAAANTGSIILIGNALKETKTVDKQLFRDLSCLLIILFAAQYALMIYTKVNHKFWSSADNSSFSQVIQEGPYQGIRVTPETEAAYLAELETLRPLLDKEGSVLYAATRTWYYLATPELSIGAYSAWLSGQTDITIERLDIYYERNPGKLPDYIFIPIQNSWNMEYFQQRILDPYGYVRISDDSAIIYSRAEELRQ